MITDELQMVRVSTQNFMEVFISKQELMKLDTEISKAAF